MNTQKLKTITFDVQIPNLEGDGIAEVVPILVQAYVDEETGEDVLTPESLDLIEKTQARRMGLMLPAEIKALRERLGLTQKQMSCLLQIGMKSYTRWETGRARPSRSINLLLCALRDGQLDIHYLRSIRTPGTRIVWTSREPAREVASAYFTAESQISGLSEWPSTMPSVDKAGHQPLTTWRKLLVGGKITAHLRSIRRIMVVCDRPAPASQRPAEHTDSPSAPRLPSTDEQRQAFRKSRFEAFLAEEAVTG